MDRCPSEQEEAACSAPFATRPYEPLPLPCSYWPCRPAATARRLLRGASSSPSRQQIATREAPPAPSEGNAAVTIRLTIDGHRVGATLNDSATALDLASLPLTLGMDDFHQTEQIAYPPRKLDTAGPTTSPVGSPSSPEPPPAWAWPPPAPSPPPAPLSPWPTSTKPP
ncbi:cyclophilin-like fold protein [Streptomyces sp. NPDC048479]|uniref:cyclophilin-like fold protein n=1 Tax=Streptomyces sp. NPDC048479 TaxID=3154725 RepID=UPI003446D587